MSMKLSVYVGPYLHCQRGDVDEEAVMARLIEGQGELRDPGGMMVMVPNADVPGIDRELWIDQNGSMEMVTLPPSKMDEELRLFRDFVADVIDDLNELNALHYVRWGVIPEMS